ncbi:MAG: hypothetical protein GXO22_07780 [Aquificae bacterium]|nr:hypothetical protein [Aquificota bacterium]
MKKETLEKIQQNRTSDKEKFSPISKIKNGFINFFQILNNDLVLFFEQFYKAVHVFLAIVLIIISFAIGVWFFHDIYKLTTGDIASGALRLLGTALILWPLSELLKAEIQLLRGQTISINLFVDIAIASDIRAILINLSEHGPLEYSYFYVITLFILAVIRFMVSYAENRIIQK